MSRKFLIKLKDVHERSGKSIYAVAKESGVVYNTAKKYLTEYVEAEKLTPEVTQLAEYYGADWRDPSVIEVIDESADTRPIEPINEEDEIKTPLSVSA